MATESQIALYENFKAINTIETASYDQFDVKRGLRNADGTGVIAGLTNIANVHGYVVSDGEKVADEGMLRYRGYDVYDLLDTSVADRRFNFEEVAYLLLMGELPTQEQLDRFIAALDAERELPDGFTASMIMRDTPPDIMNMLQRTILLLYAYDADARGSFGSSRDPHRHLADLASAAHHGADLLREAGSLQQRLHDHASLHSRSVHGRDHPVHAASRSPVHG